jgi:preprotein translocase SecE subunit
MSKKKNRNRSKKKSSSNSNKSKSVGNRAVLSNLRGPFVNGYFNFALYILLLGAVGTGIYLYQDSLVEIAKDLQNEIEVAAWPTDNWIINSIIYIIVAALTAFGLTQIYTYELKPKLLQPVYNELTKVTWPNKEQLTELFIFTVVVSGLLAVAILGLDLVFLEVKDILLKL